MTTTEAVATLNQRTPYYAIALNDTVIVYSGTEHDAEPVLRLAASDELLARMVMAFVEICEKGIPNENAGSVFNYLRYFHSESDFGPADTDVRMGIQARYVASGGVIPEGWLYE